MRAFRGFAVAAITAVLTLGVGIGAASAVTPEALPTPDTDFLTATAQTGLVQRQLGQQAVSQAKEAKVRAFARTALADRRSVDEALAKVAKATGFVLPTSVAPTDVAKVETVTVATGDQFDLAYAQLQRSMYARVVRDFRTEIELGKNKAVVAFAKDHLKVLKRDRSKAKALAVDLAKADPRDIRGGTNCASSGSSGNPSAGGSGGGAGDNGTGSGGTAPGAASAPVAGSRGGTSAGSGGVAGCGGGSGSGSNASGAGNNG